MDSAAVIERIAREVSPPTLVAAASALIGLIALAGLLHGVRPIAAQYWKLRQEHETAKASVSPEEDPAAVETLGAQVEELRAELYGEPSRLPAREVESHVIAALDHLATQGGVELVSVRPGEPAQVLMFRELPYDVEVAGGFLDLFRWLRGAEAELHPMIVKQFSMEHATGERRVSLRLRLAAYRAEDPGP